MAIGGEALHGAAGMVQVTDAGKMMRNDALAAWMFPRSLGIPAMVEISLDRLRPPDLRLQLLSTVGDTVSVMVVDGRPRPEPNTILYVQRRGPYEIARREEWPGGRLLLTLTAWPRR